MSEAEVLELINLHTNNSFNGFAVFLSLLFAYMTVAYIVGARLSKFQVIVITFLYFSAEVSLMLSLLTQTHSIETLISNHPDFTYTPLQAYPWSIASALIDIAAIIISLIFMYDIRRTHSMKQEENT